MKRYRLVDSEGNFAIPNIDSFNIALGYSDRMMQNKTIIGESFGGNRVVKERISIDY